MEDDDLTGAGQGMWGLDGRGTPSLTQSVHMAVMPAMTGVAHGCGPSIDEASKSITTDKEGFVNACVRCRRVKKRCTRTDAEGPCVR
jgi:hypothetical protein